MARTDSEETGRDFWESPTAFLESLNEFISSNSSLGVKEKIAIPCIEEGSSASEKREALKAVLSTMAETGPKSAISAEDAELLVSFFGRLYGGVSSAPFRHMYSEVCEVMYGLMSGNEDELDEGVPYGAEQLANSVGIVVGVMEERCPGTYACEGTRKLLDHINLEMTRMRYMTEQNRAVMKAIRDNEESARQYEARIREIGEDSERLRKDSERRVEEVGKEVEARLKTLQKEYIAILGIFSSVIIAFTSGMSFSSSVLQNIEKASIYRLSFVVLLVGLFMFLMVTALFVFLNRMSGIDNGRMTMLLKWGAVVFVVLIAAVVAARAFDVLSYFPIPFPL